MPHLVLEHSANLPAPLDHAALLAELHAVMDRSGLFRPADVKSRVVALDHFRVADGAPERVFAHLTVSIMAGRDLEARKRLSADLLAALRQAFAATWETRPCDLTVDVREMVRETYSKAANAATALHG